MLSIVSLHLVGSVRFEYELNWGRVREKKTNITCDTSGLWLKWTVTLLFCSSKLSLFSYRLAGTDDTIVKPFGCHISLPT